MNDAEFSAELLALYARAENRKAENPGDRWWPMVVDSLKVAVVAAGEAQRLPRREMPHLQPLTICTVDFQRLEPLTKGVKS